MMVDKRVIEKILLKQRRNIDKLMAADLKPRFLTRHVRLDGDVVCLTGIRGVGKTTMALDVIGKSGHRFAYVDISDSTFYNLTGEMVDAIVEVSYKIYGAFDWMVVDGIGALRPLSPAIAQLTAIGKRVFVVALGSVSADALPADSAIHYLYPLSFSEYCVWHDVDPEPPTPESLSRLRQAFDDFVFRGGLPANQTSARPSAASNRLADKMLTADIAGDFRKSNRECLAEMGKFIIRHSPHGAFYNALSERFGLSSENTAKKYVGLIKDTDLIYSLMRFSRRNMQRTYCEKLFAADNSFLCPADTEGRLQTIVYLQLRRFCERHGYAMHYYGNRDLECDFALCANKKMRTIIQVMFDYSDTAAVREKVAGLISLSQATGCDRLFILTDNCHDLIETKGLHIEVKPAYEFLLDRSHLIITPENP